MAGKEVKFLYLSQEDMVEAGVLDMDKCVDTIDNMFQILGTGDYLMGGPGGNEHGIRVYFPKEPKGPHMPVAGPDRRFMALVGYLGGKVNVCGEKWYGSNIANYERNLPRSILMVVLNNPETAEPLAIMDGTLISAMRTGSVPGVGAKYLARKDSEVIGVIGAGVISRACLMSIACALKNIKDVKVFDLVGKKSEDFSAYMRQKLGLNVHPVDSLEEAIKNSDVISLATAGTNPPFIKNEWLKEGCYIALSGSKTDFSEDFYLTVRKVADNWQMHTAWRQEVNELGSEIRDLAGTIPHMDIHDLISAGKLKADDIDNLGPIASGEKPGRINDEEKIILLTGGMSIEDIAWGYEIYQTAKKKGIGQELTLWKEPHWL